MAGFSGELQRMSSMVGMDDCLQWMIYLMTLMVGLNNWLPLLVQMIGFNSWPQMNPMTVSKMILGLADDIAFNGCFQ